MSHLSSLQIANQQVFFTSSEDLSFLPDSFVDLIVTSPPYWNLKDYGHPGQIGSGEPYEKYLNRLSQVWQECYRLAKANAVLAINVGNRRYKKKFYPIAFDIWRNMKGWVLWDILIWYIPNALPQPKHYMERLFDNKFEFILLFTKDGNTDYKFHKPRVPQKYLHADPRDFKRNSRGRCLGNVIRIPAYRPPNVSELNYHIAAFPEELVALLVESFTDPGDIVFDPFLGSGTTLKVARVMNRRGIGVEINGEYRNLIYRKIMEPWGVPDWKTLDILHSSTMETGMEKPRKIHWVRGLTNNGYGNIKNDTMNQLSLLNHGLETLTIQPFPNGIAEEDISSE